MYIPGCEKEIYNAVRTLGKDYTYDLIVYVAEVRLCKTNEKYYISEKNKKVLKKRIKTQIDTYMSIDYPNTFKRRSIDMVLSYLSSLNNYEKWREFKRVYKDKYCNLKARADYCEK